MFTKKEYVNELFKLYKEYGNIQDKDLKDYKQAAVNQVTSCIANLLDAGMLREHKVANGYIPAEGLEHFFISSPVEYTVEGDYNILERADYEQKRLQEDGELFLSRIALMNALLEGKTKEVNK